MQFMESVLPIVCRTTGNTTGRCRIGLTPLSYSDARVHLAFHPSLQHPTLQQPSVRVEDPAEATAASDRVLEPAMAKVDGAETAVGVGDQLLFDLARGYCKDSPRSNIPRSTPSFVFRTLVEPLPTLLERKFSLQSPSMVSAIKRSLWLHTDDLYGDH